MARACVFPGQFEDFMIANVVPTCNHNPSHETFFVVTLIFGKFATRVPEFHSRQQSLPFEKGR